METVARGNDSFFSYDDTPTHPRIYDYDPNKNKGRFTFDTKSRDKAAKLENDPDGLGINRGEGKDIHAARGADFGRQSARPPGQGGMKQVAVLPVVVSPNERLGSPEDHRESISQAKWQHFTDNTTFHGIRYIFEETPYSFRRILWTGCVLAAVAAFMWQVVMRSVVYLEHNSNVNVQVNYETQVALPAVTICNQNRHRVSATSAAGVYDFINDYYSTELTEDEVASYKMDRFNYTRMAFETAHQEEDLIEKCLWRGSPCVLENTTRFVPAYTDLGVCYTINGGHDPVQVTDAGSGTALSLTLNVEQYEYMKGPSGDAGVKILLHDSGETPLMKDLGFSVAPGTHTLAAIRRSTVKNLPQPYGKCQEDVIPMSLCIAKDKSGSVLDRCNCARLAYQSYTKVEAPLCNFTDVYTCVEPSQNSNTQMSASAGDGTPQESSTGSSCPTPCRRVLYEPSLSFAQLSKFNIDKFVLRNSASRESEIQTKLLAAMETSQRVDVTSRSKNLADIGLIKSLALQVMEILNQTTAVYSTVNHTTSHYGVGDLATNGASAVKSIVMNNEYVAVVTLRYSNVFCFTLYSLNLAQEAGYMLGLSTGLVGTGNTSQILLGLGACDLANNASLINGYLDGNYTVALPYIYDIATNATIGPLDPYMQGCIGFLSAAKPQITGILGMQFSTPVDYCVPGGFRLTSTMPQIPLSDYPATYASNITSWYHETAMDPLTIPEHVQCLAFIQQANASSAFEKVDNIVNTFVLADTARDYASLRGYLGFIDTYLRTEGMLAPSFTGFMTGGLAGCAWMKLYNFYFNTPFYADVFQQPEYVAWYDLRYIRLEQLTENFPQLGRQFSDAVDKLRAMHAHYAAYYNNLVDHLDRYVSRQSTKLELADFITSIRAQTELTSFVDKLEVFDTSVRNLQSVAFTICGDLREFTSIFFGFRIPFFNNTMIYRAELFTSIFSESTDPEALVHIANFTTNYAYHMDKLVVMHCAPFTTHAEAARFSIDDAASNLVSALTKYQTNMYAYQEDNMMHTKFYLENFLQVDIFYKEMSYESINQQVAFEALSLFSEVGGFLGLLLGASLLTVCELFDYLIISFLIRMDSMKTVKPRHQFPGVK